MTWNYRVVRKYHQGSDETSYQIHEVYYDGNGNIETWTENSVGSFGETVEELREDIRFFLSAFRKPVLEEKQVNQKIVLISDDVVELINEGHYFELLDRTSIALDYIYQFLGCHPLLKKETQLKELYDRAEEALAELYQEVGKLDYLDSSS